MSVRESIPSSREFTLAGVSYAAFVMGLFLFWPSVIGVVLAYVKRSDVAGGMLESHYNWLIRTFWWSFVCSLLILAAMLTVLVPNAVALAHAARGGDHLNLPWSLLATMVGCGVALAIVWCWYAYRIVRGLLRLSDGRPTP